MLDRKNRYLDKHALYNRWLEAVPHDDLSMIVVIPSYQEAHIDLVLNSLVSADTPLGHVEILVVINSPKSADLLELKINQATIKQIEDEVIPTLPAWITIHIIDAKDLPTKKAGVGLARKIGMDEAVRRFESLDREGLILNIDADCTCTCDYFQVTEKFFNQHEHIWAAGLHFEHRWDGASPRIREAIINYELHLRYFINAQSLIGLPFAYQTIGSCMIVRSSAYQKMGGMNIRKAGEDFYFLQKFIAIGRFGEVPQAVVYPSSRVSTRVPFGTGRAIGKAIAGDEQKTSVLSHILDLKALVLNLREIYGDTTNAWIDKLPIPLSDFLHSIHGLEKMSEIRAETSSFGTFRNRFFQWFNAFRLMKYVHFCRTYKDDNPVLEEATALALLIEPSLKGLSTNEELLMWYRHKDKQRIDDGLKIRH